MSRCLYFNTRVMKSSNLSKGMACKGGCSFHSTHIGEDGYGNHYGGMLVEHHFGTVQCYSCESCVLLAV